jgi:SNF family Na+-dependent transporter
VVFSGYLARFTATLPFAVLAVLFFRGLVLEGALEGVTVLFTPNWNVLYDPSVSSSNCSFVRICIWFRYAMSLVFFVLTAYACTAKYFVLGAGEGLD